MLEGCPVKPPKLLKAESIVESCDSCGLWIHRYPSFLGEDDGFFDCDRCNCTSVRLRDGRPYGPKSKQWDQIVKWFEECFTDIDSSDWDTVETDPPMKSLDWDAIEEWYRSHNIYRWTIRVEVEEVTHN